jgi:dGTPase
MFRKREILEKKEEATLSSFATFSKNSRGRAYPEKEHDYRTAFQRDRDRIVHSNAFRRLEYKTQVFVNHEGDYFRNRLTHTLEASSIGRTIARSLGLNEDLTECIILAHDLGHPPFGHAGETALNKLTEHIGGFDHNVQSVKVVEFLENPYPDFRGLNLTWEVREGLRKHSKKYKVEEEFLPHLQPSLEAQVAELADDIAWIAHDIDDSLKANIIQLDALLEVPIMKKIYNMITPAKEFAILRKQIVRKYIDTVVTDVLLHSANNIEINKITTVEEARNFKTRLVSFSHQMSFYLEELKKFLYNNFYFHYRLIAMAEKAKFFIMQLFNAYKSDPRQLPPQYYQLISIQGVERTIVDYICGMTDRYVQEEYKRLFHPFEKL